PPAQSLWRAGAWPWLKCYSAVTAAGWPGAEASSSGFAATTVARRSTSDTRARRMADPTMKEAPVTDRPPHRPRVRRARGGARGQGVLEFVSDGASRQLRGVRGDEPLLSALPARDAGAQEAAPRPPEPRQVRLRLRRVRWDGRWQDGQRRERVSHDDPSRVVARFPVAANSAPDQSRRSRVSAR